MKKRIYLDDERIPVEKDWIVCRNYDEFIKAITDIGISNIELISLDHDLGSSAIREFFRNVVTNNTIDYNNITEKTGYDCAKWLVELSIDNSIRLPLILVHSANPVGAENIKGYINSYLKSEGLQPTCIRNVIPFKIKNI